MKKTIYLMVGVGALYWFTLIWFIASLSPVLDESTPTIELICDGDNPYNFFNCGWWLGVCFMGYLVWIPVLVKYVWDKHVELTG